MQPHAAEPRHRTTQEAIEGERRESEGHREQFDSHETQTIALYLVHVTDRLRFLERRPSVWKISQKERSC